MIVVAFTHDLCTVPYAERFVRTIKESCLERIIFFGEDHFDQLAQPYVPVSDAAVQKIGPKATVAHPAPLPWRRQS